MSEPVKNDTRISGLFLGMGLAAAAALLLRDPIPLSLGWGMGAGALAGLAADHRRAAGNRVFHGVLAAVIGGTAVFVFATHGGA